MPITRASPRASAAADVVDEAAERICDRHGAALFSLAYAVLLNRHEAERVVVSVIADVCTEHDGVRDEAGLRRRLAYLTYIRSLSCGVTVESLTADPAPATMAGLDALAAGQRTSIALVRDGGFSYRDAALLLDLPATVVAGLLATGLRELASMGSGRGHG